MTPEQRAEVESRADRALRRGELSEALALYQSVAGAFPGDAEVEGKIAHVKENLQDGELFSAKANFKEGKPTAQTPEQEGERLFAAGDYPGAIAAYRKALGEKPDSELIRERLAEIFRLARPAAATAPAA